METISDLDLDLIFSLGDEMEKSCEHSQHGELIFGHSDSSTLSYVHALVLPRCDGSGLVRIFCDSYMEYVRGIRVRCRTCGISVYEHYQILGPVE